MEYIDLSPEEQQKMASCLKDLNKIMEGYFTLGLKNPSQIAFVAQKFLSQVILTVATNTCPKDNIRQFLVDYLKNLRNDLFLDYKIITGVDLDERVIV